MRGLGLPYGSANAISESPGLLGISPCPPAATTTYCRPSALSR